MNFIFMFAKSSVFLHNMASIGQKQGACGHLMAASGEHSLCARHDKGKDSHPCVLKEADCLHCNVLTTNRRAQLVPT